MRTFAAQSFLFVLTLLLLVASQEAAAKKPPSRGRPVPTRTGRGRSSKSVRAAPPPRRRPVYEDEEDELEDYEEEEEILEDDDEEDEYDEEILPRPRRTPTRSTKSRTSSRVSRPTIKPSRSRKPRYDDYEEEDDYERRPSRSARRRPPPRRRGGRVVPYTQKKSAFLEGFLDGLKSTMPDPGTVKDGVLSGLSTAKQATSGLSSNLYREIKGLTSSELEQVMLKATRPDDTPVKGKHVERLVGVTYQISSRYDIYDAVLRKLWSKMAEKDWRTTIKALYILHRFSSDGAPDHANALKARLRELRRTRDPKRKDKYFNSKQLLAGTATPENIKFRAFMARYAHYVMLRAQCFSGAFDEISTVPQPDKKSKKKKTPPKPITSTCLREENLNAAGMLLKAGTVCQLKDGEECENTAIASERVTSDMMSMTKAVAIALNRALKNDDLHGADPAVLQKWCAFYQDELLPQTKTLVKKVSPKLDAYGLFLPSRMGTSVAPGILEKGLKLAQEEPASDDAARTATEEKEEEEEDEEEEEEEPAPPKKEEPVEDDAVEEDVAVDDEYEYDEYEEYDYED